MLVKVTRVVVIQAYSTRRRKVCRLAHDLRLVLAISVGSSAGNPNKMLRVCREEAYSMFTFRGQRAQEERPSSEISFYITVSLNIEEEDENRYSYVSLDRFQGNALCVRGLRSAT